MDRSETRTILRSEELTCPSCIPKIERALAARDGVSRSTVHFATGRIEVLHDPEAVTAEDLAKAIGALGYRATSSPV